MRSGRFKKNVSQQGLALLYHPYSAVLLSAAVTVFMGCSLSSYNPHDPSWFYYVTEPIPVTNYAGKLGAQFAALCFYLFGAAAYTFIGIGMYTTHALWRKKAVVEEIDRIGALVTLTFTWSAALALHKTGTTAYVMAGGIVGQEVYKTLVQLLDVTCARVGIYSMIFIQVLLISRLSLLEVVQVFVRAFQTLVIHRNFLTVPFFTLARALQYVGKKIGTLMHKAFFSFFGLEYIDKKEEDPFESGFWQQQQLAQQTIKETETQELQKQADEIPAPKKKASSYTLPSSHLFNQVKKEEGSVKDESKQVAQVLEEKLSRFGVVGSVVAIKKGPVVTLFEYQPAIDTKISKIVALEQDLALALEAVSVRIVAPIPGTSRVGFEVSNKERKAVLFGESIRSSTYQQHGGFLPLILGQDTAGNQVVVDLADMPHVLVAGSTGSGKSVSLNAMLISLLCKLTPDELKLIIIDPKRLEFAAYHDIAHLLFPIITDPHKAAPVIRWLVRLMEERYQYMAQQGVRNIHEYKKICKNKKQPDELPFIVLMIDELADLMMVAGKESEEGIARLAQMARAAGIHLIVATQRPSVDVVTGVIKVNFPSRISFRLTSKIDSRTILDAAGAESLLGKGDMLFMDAQSARMRRVHGAYVSDVEITKVADAIRAQQQVIYKDVQEVVAEFQQTRQHEIHDPLLPEVLNYLDTIDQVSISLLQRRFTVGYNRAARLMELLEGQGKVMPPDGSKTRKVIH